MYLKTVLNTAVTIYVCKYSYMHLQQTISTVFSNNSNFGFDYCPQSTHLPKYRTSLFLMPEYQYYCYSEVRNIN